MLKKWLMAACIGGIALNACAADVGAPVAAASPAAVTVAKDVPPAAVQMVQKAIRELSSKVQIDSIATAPLPGFYQVIASGQLLYVSGDGKYLLNGDLIDLAAKKNVSENAWAQFRKAKLAEVPESSRIIYAPANPKYTVTVFTDINCGYCRQLHEHMADFNKAGIAVEYLAWPREGLTTTAGRPTATYTEMVSVWCAADRKAAFTAAAKNGRAPAAATCTNPVKNHFDLGRQLGIAGTPAIYAADGRVLGGYVTPAQLLQALQNGG